MVAGLGVTGLATVQFLRARGYRVVVTAERLPELPAELAADPGVSVRPGLTAPPAGTTLVVTSPGFPPRTPLFAAAAAAGIDVVGDVELAWRFDHGAYPHFPDPDRSAGRDRSTQRAGRDWLVVTGTNGKTTTVGMLEAILRAAGRTVTACGNVGWPALAAVTAADPAQDLLAAELSSFQLHYAPSVRPRAGAVLNLVEDHLDWYAGDPTGPAGPGSERDRAFAGYAADKARALTGDIAVAVVDDPGAAGLLATAPGRRVAVTAGPPGRDGLGERGGRLIDNAFGAGDLASVDLVRPAGTHNRTNALTAAALALAAGVTGPDVAAGLAAFAPGPHRNVVVAQRAGVRFVDDSKATNPHSALASLTGYPRVVWIAGGQLKGASIDELVAAVADRLAGVVVLGVDAPLILAALSRHAADVPVRHVTGTDHRIMTDVVRAAADLARPGDTVLLAPAAASLDMFTNYAARGHAFAAAVAGLDAGAGSDAGAEQADRAVRG